MNKSTRVTVPEGSIALLLSTQLACELFELSRLVRGAGKRLEVTSPMRSIARDVLVSCIDAGIVSSNLIAESEANSG